MGKGMKHKLRGRISGDMWKDEDIDVTKEKGKIEEKR